MNKKSKESGMLQEIFFCAKVLSYNDIIIIINLNWNLLKLNEVLFVKENKWINQNFRIE